MENQFSYSKEKIRMAIFSFFFAQGLCMSSWASRIPYFKELFADDYAFYWGLILFMIPVGKFVAIPLAGYLVSQSGSRRIVQMSITGYALSLWGIGMAQHVYLLGVLLFLFGVFWNLCDISFNTQGIEVERMYGKPIMATFHGGWSVGACTGALIGFIMILLDVAPFFHFLLVAALIFSVVAWKRKYLQECDAAQERKPLETASRESKWKMLFHKPETLLLQLGLTGFFALIIESAMFDWSAVYFESVVHAPKSLQIGFLVFMVMMSVGRFSTNYAYRLFGKRKVLQIAGSLIFAGFFLSALLGNSIESTVWKVAVHSVGFMLVGLGISCIVPTIYSFVGDKSKTPVGIALTILSSISFIGSLVAPLFIGAISQMFSIRIAYILIGLLGICIVAMTKFSRAFKTNAN